MTANYRRQVRDRGVPLVDQDPRSIGLSGYVGDLVTYISGSGVPLLLQHQSANIYDWQTVDPSGPAGGGGSAATFTATNGSGGTMLAGCPVVVDASNAKKGLATSLNLSRVIGLVTTTIGNTLAATIQPAGPLTLAAADWDAITGQSGGLTQGSDYYLGTSSGTLSTSPPTTLGQCVVLVGRAASATVMDIAVGPVVQL